MVQHDDLGSEIGDSSCGLVLRIGGDVSTLDVLHADVLDVETNVVTGNSLGKRLVVHLNGLDLSGELDRGESNNHTGLDDTGLHTSHGHCANSSDFVHVLRFSEL